jgi:hypothetical protein
MEQRIFEKDDGALRAHAWITVDGRVVQGGPVSDVTKLAAFR